MPIKMFNQKEAEKIRSDLLECQSLKEDIENAKKAGIPGIEILEQRYIDCLTGIQGLHEVYIKRSR